MLLWELSPAIASQGTLVAPVTHGTSPTRAGPCCQFGNGCASTGQAARVTGLGEHWGDEQMWLLPGVEQL